MELVKRGDPVSSVSKKSKGLVMLVKRGERVSGVRKMSRRG